MLLVFVGIICGGAGKLCISVELVDSVDLRFLERVGAMLSCLGVFFFLFREVGESRRLCATQMQRWVYSPGGDGKL